jgi:hypothetical protein
MSLSQNARQQQLIQSARLRGTDDVSYDLEQI